MGIGAILDVIDGLEEIRIREAKTLKILYEGKKYKIKNVDLDAEVFAVYTVAGKINIEIEYN